MPKRSPARPLLLGCAAAAFAGLLAVGLAFESPFVRVPSAALLGGLLVSALLYLAWRLLRRFLWRVGRRLAFSYFLIGVLPIPMLALLLALTAYLLSGYYMANLYRTEAARVQAALDRAAESGLERLAGTPSPVDGVAFAYYRGGSWLGGDRRAPRAWPAWLEGEDEAGPAAPGASYTLLADGQPMLIGAARRGGSAVLAFTDGPVAAELSRRSGVWIELLPTADSEAGKVIDIRLGETSLTLGLRRPKPAPEAERTRREFFGPPPEGARALTRWARRPLLWWGEITSPPHMLSGGTEPAPALAVYLNASPYQLADRLFTGSAEFNTRVWAGMIAVVGLLTSIYCLALLMASYMIVGLSRAVNRLSRATDAVRQGDFAVRIPVRRRDQLGELQRSFNEMAGNLESLVATAAQKELLEKELTIARELQRSLLPVALPASERVEFTTLFEPSAAIGGDYFDILPIDPDRLAVVIADVAGHGLPTGLRMAMIKSALAILVQDGKPATEIMARLDEIVRGEARSRFFVTATLAVVDFEEGRLEITNAGHPPTYLLRQGEVEEIELPSTPLGALGPRFAQRTLCLTPHDVVVWLSDGLIETASPQGEPFGYGRVREALRGPAAQLAEVRDRLLAAVERHAGSDGSTDDRTLVAMGYYPPTAGAASPRKE